MLCLARGSVAEEAGDVGRKEVESGCGDEAVEVEVYVPELRT